MGFKELYAQLNVQQKEAVDAIEGPVMVIAGPGTGKTQVLAMRVANILRETQMDPDNILCLTFTESGVQAMRKRLQSIIGAAALRVRIHTFHSFCNFIIQDSPELFPKISSGQVIGEADRVALWRELIDGLSGTSVLKPFGRPYLYEKDLVQAVRVLKQEQVSVEKLLSLQEQLADYLQRHDKKMQEFFTKKPSERTDSDCEEILDVLSKDAYAGVKELLEEFRERFYQGVESVENKRAAQSNRTKLKADLKKWWLEVERNLPKQKELVKLYENYNDALLERGWYDYEDMIVSVVEELGRNDDLLAEYQEQFQYILVDEYQDTNGSQNEAVRLLGSWDESPNVFVVGDDQQSIYRFQGASLENLLAFYDRYKDTVKIVTLRENYRSQQSILDAAGAMVENNEESIHHVLPNVIRDLVAQTKQRHPVSVHVYGDERSEVLGVVQHVEGLLQQGVEAHEIAILYRNNSEAKAFTDALSVAGILFTDAGGVNALDEEWMRQLLRLLFVIHNLHDNELFFEVLHSDWLGFNPLEVAQVGYEAGSQRLGIFEVIQKRDSEKWSQFVENLVSWQKASTEMVMSHWMMMVAHESGWVQAVTRETVVADAMNALRAVWDEVSRLEQTHSRFRLPDFVRALQLLEESGVALMSHSRGVTGVQLMTAHKSKGLEWQHVFVTGVRDRRWGNVAARSRLTLPPGIVEHGHLSKSKRDEDERRLLFVACTRAREGLTLSYSVSTNEGRELNASRFLSEFPDELLEVTETEHKNDLFIAENSSISSGGSGGDDRALRAWLTDVVERQVLSVTHVNNYLECPRLYYHRNLLRIPAAKSKALVFGTAVHEALREVYDRLTDERNLNVGEALRVFEETLRRERLPEAEEADSLDLGRAVLPEYFSEYGSVIAPALATELDFRSQRLLVRDVPITGVIDRVDVLDAAQRTVRVVDYKTGNPDGKIADLKPGGRYWRQLVFYRLLGDLSKQFNHQITEGILDFVQPSKKTGKFVQYRYEYTRDDVGVVSEEIETVWKEIQDLAFLDDSRACGECEACVVYS